LQQYGESRGQSEDRYIGLVGLIGLIGLIGAMCSLRFLGSHVPLDPRTLFLIMNAEHRMIEEGLSGKTDAMGIV
jgi:hypothetical protein